ncbi:MAG: FKBP-type peptidyl-prolyl cis-trans isomerase SlyD [Porticoccus sp.]|jgi:FKBP-type peptidyl-prolyl cis-trans isomerase SlyD
MKIKQDSVVRFHYRLRDESGEEEEQSHDGEPNIYMHGHRGITPGLEAALTGKEVGDVFSVTLSPEEGFGVREEGREQRVPIKHLMEKVKPEIRMVVSIQTDMGPRQAVILKVGKFNVDVDTNHPLAGKIVTFDIEIVEVREAAAEEIKHGHPHGDGGCHQ